MYLQGKFITDITEADILELFRLPVKEGRTLDYKRELSLDDKENKKQNFIIDVTALYNTDGGCIIYGIEEKKNERNENTGFPDTIIHQPYENKERFEQQLHSIIKDNTDPSIPNIVVQFLTVEGKELFIVGVPRGLGLPSMITYRDLNRFHRRSVSGNYVVTTFELNQMFLQNQAVKEKASLFRSNRIAAIKSGEVFPDMEVKGDYLLHLVPFSFLDERIYDLPPLVTSNLKIYPVNQESYYSKNLSQYNLDGLLTYKFENGQKTITSCIQYFRNGIIEAYTNRCHFTDEKSSQVHIRGNEIVTTTIFTVSNMVEVFKALEVEPPFAVYLNLLGVNNAMFITPPSALAGYIMRSDVLLPPVLVNSYDFTYHELFELLKPIFNILWQGVNLSECPPIESFIKFQP